MISFSMGSEIGSENYQLQLYIERGLVKTSFGDSFCSFSSSFDIVKIQVELWYTILMTTTKMLQ